MTFMKSTDGPRFSKSSYSKIFRLFADPKTREPMMENNTKIILKYVLGIQLSEFLSYVKPSNRARESSTAFDKS